MQQRPSVRHWFSAVCRLGLLTILALVAEIALSQPANKSISPGVLAVAPCQNKITALWGLCRDDGSAGPPLTEQKYVSIGAAGTGAEHQIYPARLSPGDRFGYLNAAGRWAIEPQFIIALPFTEGLAVVSDGVNSAAIDSSGALVVDWFEGMLFPYREGLACVVPRGSIRLGVAGEWRKRLFGGGDEKSYASPWWQVRGKTGFIDKTGKVILAPTYEPKLNYLFASCGFNNMGYAAMRLNGKDGLIDRQGRWVIDPKFDYLGIVFSGNRKVLAVVAEQTLKKGVFLDTVERLDGSVDAAGVVTWREPGALREVPVAGGFGRTLFNLLLFPQWQRDLLNDDVSAHTLSAWAGSLGLGTAAALGIWRRGERRRFNRLLLAAMVAACAGTTVLVTFLAGVFSLYATAVLIIFAALMNWRHRHRAKPASSQIEV